MKKKYGKDFSILFKKKVLSTNQTLFAPKNKYEENQYNCQVRFYSSYDRLHIQFWVDEGIVAQSSINKKDSNDLLKLLTKRLNTINPSKE